MATQPDKPSTFDLAALKKLYAEARDATRDARKSAETAQDYYDDKQWTSEEIKVLRKRKQPEIWINRIKPAVNGILGVLEQGSSDPRAYPRTSEDNDAAEIVTDALRFSADQCRWQRTKLQIAKTYLITGVGACIVEVDEDGDPWPRLIREGEFIYDPHSRDPDFEDARWMGVAKWMYVDDVKLLYPEAEISAKDIAPTAVSFEDEDKPASTWADTKRNRVLIVELYVNAAGWKHIVFYGGGVLSETPSPYVDEFGTPTNPIVAQSCFVDRDNARYGIVKTMIPVQDEINMRRSRLLHMVNSRQLERLPDAQPIVDAEEARAEAARPDGVIPYGYRISTLSDLASGQAQLLSESKAEIERMGPNPAVLGREASSASGRSKLVQQQAGLTELTPVFGGIEDLELRVYRQMWMRIRQFWQEPKMIRVTDDIGAAKFLTMNEPVVQEMPAIVMGPDGQPTVGMQQQIVEVRNRPAEMDMDIIIDSTPDTANIQQEQFAELARLAAIYGPQEVPFDDLLEASNLPKKRALIEKREARKAATTKTQQQMQPPPDPRIEADVMAKQAKAARDGAEAEGKQLENQAAAFQLGTAMGAAAGL